MKHDQKRAFTVVELVVVIAVIAVLAAVLIPTFSNLMEKAKQSADEQTVDNMNLALEAEELAGTKPEDMEKVKEILVAAGFRVPTEATGEGYQYYWIKNDNRVVLVKMDGETPKEIVYPSDLATKYKTNLPTEWYSLKGEPCKHDGELKYEALVIKDESYYHKVICTKCEQFIGVEVHDKSGEAGACSKCTYMTTIVIPAECDHKNAEGEFDLEFVALALDTGGSQYHMVVCNICKKVITREASHQWGEDGKTCEDCGFVRLTGDSGEECKHAIKTYKSNVDGTHTVTCGICNESWTDDCQYILVKDESAGTETIKCTYCGYEYPKTEHVHTYTYQDNGNGTHDRTCTASGCDDPDAANVKGIACSYGPVQTEADGSKYRECIYCGHKKAQTELKNGLQPDGYYYKNDQLFTGEEDGYEFEYGKLVLRVDSTTPGGGIDYEWNFEFKNDSGQPIDPKYVTDNIVLKLPDNEDKFAPGECTSNHVVLNGFDNYTVNAVSLTPSINVKAAMDMLKEAVDSGNTKGIMDLIERVFYIDATFYPVGTVTSFYNDWKTKTDTYSTYAGYLKDHFEVDHLYELLTEEYWNYLASGGGWELTSDDSDLFGGATCVSTGSEGNFVSALSDDDWVWDGSNYYRYRDPEYVLMFWKFNYEHAFFGVISYDATNTAKLGNDIWSFRGGLYRNKTIDWKEASGRYYSSKFLSTLDLYDGVNLEDKKDFFVTSAAHMYLMMNANQNISLPNQSFNIMLQKKA